MRTASRDVDQFFTYADPDPQNLKNADLDPGHYNHQIDFNPYFKSQEKMIFANQYLLRD